jgi:hypothetical protein
MWLVLVSISLYLILTPGDLHAAVIPKVRIGINLAGITDYASQWAFTNAFASARPWTGEKIGISGYYLSGLDIDENGWLKSLKPGETAFSLMFVDIDKKYPEGEYLLTYDGEGQLQFKWNVSVRRQGKGHVILDVKPDNAGIEVRITQTMPHDPIRNIRLMMPGYWEQHDIYPFHHLFLDRINAFTIYRFMDWQEINNSKITSWSERAKVSDATFASGKGVPLEYMVLLCNIQRASPWFNIPHLADNAYVEEFAKYVKEHLDPTLDIYLEYSNEVWNTMFEQHRYAVTMGRKAGLSDNDFQAYARFYSQRSMEILNIWNKVFGDGKRIKLILSGQIGNIWLTKQILDWRGSHKFAHAYAVAPYFGGKFCYGDYLEKTKEMSINQLEVSLIDDIKGVGETVSQQSQYLRKYKLPLYAYEAGQHLVCGYGNENEDTLNKLFDNMNKDKSMKYLYLLYLDLWKRNGGDVMMMFSSIAKQSKWGRWGITENMYAGRASSPKLDAILDFIESESRNVR